MHKFGSYHFSSRNLLCHSFVGCLNDIELAVGMTLEGFDPVVWGFLGAVKHEGETLEGSTMFAFTLEADEETPLSAWILAPGVGGHEGPVGESILAVIIFGTAGQNHGSEKKEPKY